MKLKKVLLLIFIISLPIFILIKPVLIDSIITKMIRLPKIKIKSSVFICNKNCLMVFYKINKNNN